MTSKLRDAIRLRTQPVAVLKSDTLPQGALQFKEGGGGCLIALLNAAAEGRTAGRPAIQLSEYQLEKARQILAEDPTISHSELARQFTGISKQTLIKLLRKEGLI